MIKNERLKNLIEQAVQRALDEKKKFVIGVFSQDEAMCPISWMNYFFGKDNLSYAPYLIGREFNLDEEEIWQFVYAFDQDDRSTSQDWRDFAKKIREMIGPENLVSL